MSQTSVKEETIYGVGAQFESAKALLHAAEKVTADGYKKWDTYSPFPVHGMDDAMGLSSSKVSALSLGGGICGCLTAFIMIFYTSGIDYPLIVQGKPYFAFEPAFPIFFELTILLTAFGTLAGMLILNRMPTFYHPIFNWDLFIEKGQDDGFFVVIEAKDPLFSAEKTGKYLESLGGMNVTVIKEEA
ncbi:MAG: DUF3341 domain-containing protein [Verrucomicrobiota bacterium]